MKKKIAIIAPYLGMIDRGAESFVKEIADLLAEYYEIDFFTITGKTELPGNNIGIPIKHSFLFIIHERIFNRFKLYRKVIWKLYYLIPDIITQFKFSRVVYHKYLLCKQYDLIFPNNGIWGVVYAQKLRKQKGTPFIYTGHGGVGEGEKLILKRKPNMYICLTERQYTWARQYSDKICVIGNGVDTKKFHRHKADHLPKLVLSVGALTEFKRHELTIKALQYIPDVNLLILGKGELERELVGLAKKLLGDRCIIKSASYEDMPFYYENADLFVLPSSKGEAYGIVYLEAMASNLPIVAPDDSMRHEIIGDAGLFCDVTNPKEYGRCMELALNKQWGDIPLETAKKHDWSEVSKKYIEVIEGLI